MGKRRVIPTVAECVGGGCDGVQLDPPDKDEPDDWPDCITLEHIETGKLYTYWLWDEPPLLSPEVRLYKYIYEDLLEDE